MRNDGAKSEGLAGMYVKFYDPRMDWDMHYTLTVCDVPHEAKIFNSPEDAWQYYQQTSPNVPVLNDKYNRPLTSWRVEVEQLRFN